MYSNVSGLLACGLVFSACLSAAEIKGTVVDPSGAPVAGAQVSVLDRVGVRAQTVTSPGGACEVSGPDTPDARIVITAPGFNTETLGTPNQAPLPFQVGQELTRRPENSGSVVSSFTHGRITAAVTGYFRGRTLYEEPTCGATDGLFWNPGYANLGINVNYALGHGLTAYGNLRNALNWHYEEVFGYPSPRLNFVSGFKWTLARAK